MAKTLHYRRHSIKDGADGQTIGPKGIELALFEGGNGSNPTFDRLFHGPLVRTAQTALAFCSGLMYAPDSMPVVEEIGTDALFAEIATPELREAVKAGASNFDALVQVHGEAKAKEWAAVAAEGVCKMFDAMGENETAVAFGHSPVIELAAWRMVGYATTSDDLRRLDDLEGIVFTQQDSKAIEVSGKISVEK